MGNIVCVENEIQFEADSEKDQQWNYVSGIKNTYTESKVIPFHSKKDIPTKINSMSKFNAFIGRNTMNKYSIDYKEIESKSRIEANVMDNSQILEKYIEKVDRDQSDLRSDIRASEQRTSDKIAAIEERMDARLNRIEDMLLKNDEKLDNRINMIESKIQAVDASIDTKLETFRGDIKEHKFFRVSSAIGIIGVCLATIIGIATMINQ